MKLLHKPIVIVALSIGLFCTLLTPTFAGGFGADDSAKKTIAKHARLIMTAAHPTVTFSSTQYQKRVKTNDGFELLYRFNWKKSNGDLHYTQLAFCFDKRGVLQEIEGRRRSNFLAPFVATNLAVGVLREEILDTDTIKNSATLRGLIQQATSAQEMLVFYLRTQR